MPQSFKPIVVAVDPSERELRRTRRLFEVAKLWQQPKQKIQPVSVISPMDIGWPIGLLSDMQAKLTDGVIKRVTQHLKSISQIEAPQVLYADGVSLTSSAQALATWASAQDSDVILAHAHAGEKPKVSGLGSFTERLIGIAGSNVVIVGNRAVLRKKIAKIIFATDFSEHSQAAFNRVIDIANRFGAEIILFHHLSNVPTYYSVNAYGVVLDPVWIQEFMNAEVFRTNQKGEVWAGVANQRGAPCRFVLDQGTGGLAARIKFSIRRERADLLALSIHRTGTAQVFLGRTLRSLFSVAHCPVLVMNARTV